MKFNINFSGEVNIENVDIEYFPTEEYNYYDDMFINFDSCLYWVDKKTKKLMSSKHIQISTNIYDYSIFDTVDNFHAPTYVNNIIVGLLDGTITDDEIKNIIILYNGGRDYLIRDISDDNIVNDLIKMIRKAMIEYQI